jgi:hydrogenase maturation protease
MRPLLIIGYGNPLRSDDGVGWKAAQDLTDLWPALQVRVKASYQLMPEMAEDAAQARLVIFIDACWDSLPGRIRSCAVTPDLSGTTSMTHHLSPQGLLATAKALFGSCPEAIIFSIGGGSFEHGEKLSDSVRAAYPDLMVRIKKLVKARLDPAGKEELCHA